MQLPFMTTVAASGDPWKNTEHIALQELLMEAIFSELLLLPQPRLPIGYFAVVVANLFALDTAALAPKVGFFMLVAAVGCFRSHGGSQRLMAGRRGFVMCV